MGKRRCVDPEEGYDDKNCCGGGEAPRGKPQHHRPIDMVRDMVAPAAGRLGDGG
jgi:hypothetical protein